MFGLVLAGSATLIRDAMAPNGARWGSSGLTADASRWGAQRAARGCIPPAQEAPHGQRPNLPARRLLLDRGTGPERREAADRAPFDAGGVRFGCGMAGIARSQVRGNSTAVLALGRRGLLLMVRRGPFHGATQPLERRPRRYDALVSGPQLGPARYCVSPP